MTRTIAPFAAAFALMATHAMAAPVLKPHITVAAPIVTVADMFDDADQYAERALFRSPAPGTAGEVSIEDIRNAAARIGMVDFENPGLLGVSVARFGKLIDTDLLTERVSDTLSARGFLSDDVIADITFDSGLDIVHADSADAPLRMTAFDFTPASGRFVARFDVAGRSEPLTARGTAELLVEVPHLADSLIGTAIIGPDDVEMRAVPIRVADTGSFSSLDQVVGKQLRRPTRAGKMLQPGDVSEPVLITRTELVTLIYRSGPLTLTVKGQALANASAGEAVRVLNLMSSKVITGTATGAGTVSITGFGAGDTRIQ